MDDIYKNIDEYKSKKNCKILTIKLIADMLSNKKPNEIVTELFVRCRKLNIFLFLLHNLILFRETILD